MKYLKDIGITKMLSCFFADMIKIQENLILGKDITFKNIFSYCKSSYISINDVLINLTIESVTFIQFTCKAACP